MLVAILTGQGRPHRTLEWHIGEHFDGDMIQKREKEGYVCTYLQVDGHELEYVTTHFKNIPLATTGPEMEGLPRVMRWRGEVAAFIFDHLPVKWT